jgi:pSer/pThr/pTyr-binding forkhead associated (FHA) protein
VSAPSLVELWQACGGAGKLRLLIERAGQLPRGVVIPTPFAVVGRAETCDIVLDDEDITKRHAYLQVIDGRLWCFDLLSRTGTFWRQRRESAGWFDGTEGVRVGPFHLQTLLRENIAPSAVNPLLAVRPEHDPLPTLTLEFPHATTNGVADVPAIWQLDRPLTYIGQSQLCKIRLRSPSVSRFHCSLLRAPHGVWVIDLLGREGISVNGASVRWAPLRDGDRLQVGQFEIKVRAESRQTGAASVTAPINGALLATPMANDQAAASTPNLAMTTTPKSGNLAPLPWPVLAPAQLPALTTAGGTDSAQGLLMAFANQFAQMQQQMFDQFQQTTVMMLQMFSSLHRDQFELIREELEELRGLNREMHSLQIELANHKATPPTSVNGRQPTAPPKLPATVAAPPALASSPSVPAPAFTSSSRGMPTTFESPLAAHQTSAKPESTKHKPTAETVAPPSTPTNPTSTSAPQVPAGHDVHAWLSQRFTDLQQERQTRWQKLVGTLLGK